MAEESKRSPSPAVVVHTKSTPWISIAIGGAAFALLMFRQRMLESKLRHTERRLQANMITTIADIMKRIQSDLHKELQAAHGAQSAQITDAPSASKAPVSSDRESDKSESESDKSESESESENEIDDNLSEVSFE
jgi:hypothetical protein